MRQAIYLQKLIRYLAATLAGLFVLMYSALPQAIANVRDYAWTEQYNTLPQGSVEIESWTTIKVPHGTHSNENEIQYQGEVEYGVTSHWTVAHYERWLTQNKAGSNVNDETGEETPQKDSTVYQGFKFESKYRLGEKGKYWVDPLLYLEWSTEPRERKRSNALEGKIVLSKDIKSINVSYNQIIESHLGSNGRTEHGYALGMSYEILAQLRLGAELVGTYWKPENRERNEIATGPTVRWENRWFWITAGGLFGMNHSTDDYQARIIAGVSL